ncbi:MAG TPA: hypothetical protein VJV77_09580 [Casimicrobiaceae bacterium]|nr:hypothetical protein [Casimicrobiaceae bacterium]
MRFCADQPNKSTPATGTRFRVTTFAMSAGVGIATRGTPACMGPPAFVTA